MLRLTLSLCLACAACAPVGRPTSAKTVAAYEVPLPTATDRQRFIALLSQKAEAAGFHVGAATDAELKAVFPVSPQTISVTVWRGENDDEPIASAMNFQGQLGRVWIAFSLGEDPARSQKFREALIPVVRDAWPDTASLPIMPSGAIPLADDLVRTPQGYIVNASAASKYQAESQ